MKAARTTSNAAAVMAVAIIFGYLQLRLVPVNCQRQSIRGEIVRAERDRISGENTYQRPIRDTPTSPFVNDIPIIGIGDNDNDNDNNNINININKIPTPNLVLVPQCDPADPISFYNSNGNNAPEDTTTDCDRYLPYCGKKYSRISFNSWADFVYPETFYDTVELMYDRCFATCVGLLPGGTQEFCAMPEPPPQEPIEESYCFSVSGSWNDELVAEEANVLEALNERRDDPAGGTCTRKALDPATGNIRVVQGLFPRSSPVVPNEALRCAARIQAKNIVDATIEQNGAFPSNLHKACPSSPNAICEDFGIRIDGAGYGYFTNGFGYINEVTAAGYRSADAVVDGWKASTSGHCEAILKQESKIVPTEVGVGYYKDPETGMTGHVVIVAQRNL